MKDGEEEEEGRGGKGWEESEIRRDREMQQGVCGRSGVRGWMEGWNVMSGENDETDITSVRKKATEREDFRS